MECRGTLGTYPCLGFRTTLESLGPNSRQAGLTSAPASHLLISTHLTDANACSRVVLTIGILEQKTVVT